MTKQVEFFIDLDGTLAGSSEWKGFFRNTIELFKGPRFEIPIINWSILTARPKVDRIIIKGFCKKFKLYPKEIITTDTYFYHFMSETEITIWKSNILMQRANENLFNDKVVYVDDNVEIRSKIIKHPKLITCSSKNIKNILKKGSNEW